MLRIGAILLVACVLAAQGQSNSEIPPQPHDKNVTTTVKPTPPTTTTTTTTVAPTTSSTPTTPTTSTTPTTPTTPTTTNRPTTPTTTNRPITTTSKPTPKPTPTPVPSAGTWTVNSTTSNKTCIVAQLAIQIVLQKNNSTVKVNLPTNANSTGTCGEKDEVLQLSWSDGNVIVFNFNKTNTSKFELKSLNVAVNVSIAGENATVYKFTHEKCEFSAPLQNSYKCYKEQILNLNTTDKVNVTGYLHISQVQLQAFHNATGKHFDTAVDCESSQTPDVVPIVVGCVLAALVVMVLVAYLFGRRRCQARGYLSMFAETKTEADYIPMKNLSCFN